jgi:hypothetical protein
VVTAAPPTTRAAPPAMAQTGLAANHPREDCNREVDAPAAPVPPVAAVVAVVAAVVAVVAAVVDAPATVSAPGTGMARTPAAKPSGGCEPGDGEAGGTTWVPDAIALSFRGPRVSAAGGEIFATGVTTCGGTRAGMGIVGSIGTGVKAIGTGGAPGSRRNSRLPQSRAASSARNPTLNLCPAAMATQAPSPTGAGTLLFSRDPIPRAPSLPAPQAQRDPSSFMAST